jgi:flagellar hook assembly protein FlgD
LPTATPDVPTVLDKNVFNPLQGGVVHIGIKPPQDGQVFVRIYNIAGVLVRPLAELDLNAGITYQATWDGRNGQANVVASGVYFVSIQGAGIRSIRKVIVLK